MIVVVEHPPQVFPGRQPPVPLELGSNRGPVDGGDPVIFHSGNGILSNCHFNPAGSIDHAVHVVARFDCVHGGESEAHVNCDTGHNQILATRLLDRGDELRIIPCVNNSGPINHWHIREQGNHLRDKRAVWTLTKTCAQHRVIREEKLAVVIPRGHALSRRKGALKLKHTAGLPLILYPNAPRPSYADQVLSFYRDRGMEPNVAFEVRQPWTALGLVAAGVGIALVPSSVRQLGRGDVEYLNLDEPEISSPIVMSYRTNDGSTLLAHILNLIDEFDDWTEAKIAEFS